LVAAIQIAEKILFFNSKKYENKTDTFVSSIKLF